MEQIKVECVGYSVAADLIEGGEGKPVLLNLIGFNSSKDRYIEFMHAVNKQADFTTLTLDYSGHGESPFDLQELTPAQNFLEVVTTFDYLKQAYKGRQVYVMGASYGGYLAAQLAKYRQFEKLVLRAPALYEPQDFYAKWKDSDMERRHEYRLSNADLIEHPLFQRVNNFSGNVFVVTHQLDDICPANSTSPFVKAFGAEHWDAEGFKHSFSKSEVADRDKREYYKKVTEWLCDA